MVGLKENDEESGCSLRLPVADRMGNMCIHGGAGVGTHCEEHKDVVGTVTDMDDGSYILEWRCKRCPWHQTRLFVCAGHPLVPKEREQVQR